MCVAISLFFSIRILTTHITRLTMNPLQDRWCRLKAEAVSTPARSAPPRELQLSANIFYFNSNFCLMKARVALAAA